MTKLKAEYVVIQRKIAEFNDKFRKDEEFKQEVYMYLMFGTSFLIFLAYIFSNSEELVEESDEKAIIVASSASLAVPSTIYITKREQEKLEGVDLDGKSDILSLKRRFTTDVNELKEAQDRDRQMNKLSSSDLECMRIEPRIVRDNPSGEFRYFTPRKVFDLPVLQRSLKKLGWTETKDLKEADLVLKGQPRIAFRQLRKGKMYYDMVSALGRIGSKKKTQLATLRNHVKKYGCTFESLHIQPLSFDMNRPSDCNKFFKNEDKGKMWVIKSCKNGEGSKGQGIEVIDDLSKKREEFGECIPNAMNYVAQEYIEKPLLVQGSKFDMRVYLYVASTSPYIVFFNPGYIRRSLADYKPKSTKKDDVLTNYHVQMNREDFDPSKAMWSFKDFIQYLKDTELCVACGDIEISLAKISRLVFDSGREYYKRHAGSFQIVGLDFMMDEYLNVMFIEGNVSPGMGSHKLKWKSNLMDDLILMMYKTTTLIHETPDKFDLRIGDRIFGNNGNYWELVVNEKLEQCNKKYRFNPCKELKRD